MEPSEFKRRLSKAAWSMTLEQFAELLGKTTSDLWVRENFLRMQTAGLALGALPDEILVKLVEDS